MIFVFCFSHLSYAQPEIITLLPSVFQKGQISNVLIKAEGVVFTENEVMLDFGSGVEVKSVKVHHPQMLTAVVQVHNTAIAGFRKLRITTAFETFEHDEEIEVMDMGSEIRLMFSVYPSRILNMSSFDPFSARSQPLIYNLMLLNDAVDRSLKIKLTVSHHLYGAFAEAKKTITHFPANAMISLNNREFDHYDIIAENDRILSIAAMNDFLPAGTMTYSLELFDEADSLLLSEEYVDFLDNDIADIELLFPGNRLDFSPEIIHNPFPVFEWSSTAHKFVFSLYELLPGQTNESEIINSIAVFEVETYQTHLVYPAYARILEHGKTYAWQLKSFYPSSKGEEVVRSELFWFSFAADEPLNLISRRIELHPEYITMLTNSEHRFTAKTFDDSDAPALTGIRWRVIPSDMGTISQNGLFRPGDKSGTAVVLASGGVLDAFAVIHITDSIVAGLFDIDRFFNELFPEGKSIYLNTISRKASRIYGSSEWHTSDYESGFFRLRTEGPIRVETVPALSSLRPAHSHYWSIFVHPHHADHLKAGMDTSCIIKLHYDVYGVVAEEDHKGEDVFREFRCSSCPLHPAGGNHYIVGRKAVFERSYIVSTLKCKTADTILTQGNKLSLSADVHPAEGITTWFTPWSKVVANELSIDIPQPHPDFKIYVRYEKDGVYADDSTLVVSLSKGELRKDTFSEKYYLPPHAEKEPKLRLPLFSIQESHTPLYIRSPKAGDTVVSGDFVILCDVNPSVVVDPSTVRLYIEGAEISALKKVYGNTIVVLMTHRLRPDYYFAELVFRDTSGMRYSQSWRFHVVKATQQQHIFSRKKDEKAVPLSLKPARVFFVSNSRFTHIRGSASDLRDEMLQQHDLRLTASFAVSEHISVPLFIALSNRSNQPSYRDNRFMTGFESRNTALKMGDIPASYQRHILNGIYIRGVELSRDFRGAKIQYIYGSLKRAVEPNLLRHHAGDGFPPPAMRNDSIYYQSGVFRRNIGALNLIFDAVDGTKFNVVIMRSTDDTNSISFSLPAAQNFIIGASNQAKSRNNVFLADIGIAYSIVTNDIGRGQYSKHQMNVIRGANLPLFYELYDKAVVFNGSSQSLTSQSRANVAYYGRAQLNLLKQEFLFNLDRVGSAFYSAGSPYLVNDRLNFSVRDRFSLLNNKLRLMLSYDYYGNNLSRIYKKSMNTHTAGMNAQYLSKNRNMRYIFSYRHYLRNEKSINGEWERNSIVLWRLSLGYTYSFSINSKPQSLTMSYNFSDRKTVKYELAGRKSHFLNLMYNALLPYHLFANAFYNSFVFAEDTSVLDVRHIYGFRLGWKDTEKIFHFSAGAFGMYNTGDYFTGANRRTAYDICLGLRLFKGLEIEVSGNYGLFLDAAAIGMFYDEWWAVLRLRYILF